MALSLASRARSPPTPFRALRGRGSAPPGAPGRTAVRAAAGGAPRARARRSGGRRRGGDRGRASAGPAPARCGGRGRRLARARAAGRGEPAPRGRSRARRRRSGSGVGRRCPRGPCRGVSTGGAPRFRAGSASGRRPPAASPRGRRGWSRGRHTRGSSRQRSNPTTLRPLVRRLLIVSAVLLTSAAPARAELVQLKAGHGVALARRGGGVELAPELRIWRVNARTLARLRRAGAVAVAVPERLL